MNPIGDGGAGLCAPPFFFRTSGKIEGDFDHTIEKIEKKRKEYNQEREAVEQPLKLKHLQA
ncbi:MAG: hypothetical protein IPN76_12205 [Saprospiraceae bacterium]|nr:hypothetical protein [Saprospiraceae bacterium]